MAKLKALDLERNTLIILTADNGWAGGQHGVWGMGDHTRPLSAFETTMRVPLIFRQTGRIPAGRVGNLMVSHRDFLPSLLDYLGLGQALPARNSPAAATHPSCSEGKNRRDGRTLSTTSTKSSVQSAPKP